MDIIRALAYESFMFSRWRVVLTGFRTLELMITENRLRGVSKVLTGQFSCGASLGYFKYMRVRKGKGLFHDNSFLFKYPQIQCFPNTTINFFFHVRHSKFSGRRTL